jgi:hypothetical protein
VPVNARLSVKIHSPSPILAADGLAIDYVVEALLALFVVTVV